MNPLKKLQEFGQSVYMDEIRRKWIEDGELRTMIERDGLRGVTSNPKIFSVAISAGNDYDEQIGSLVAGGASVAEVYEGVVIKDIQDAADEFRGVYEDSDGRYGFVSLEVDPRLARKKQETIDEAVHLWEQVDRPNVFIKIPGTAEGLPAVEECLYRGVNVNITLLFGLDRYREVAECYLRALERRVEEGLPVDRLASVASFFLSRIDAKIDPRLDAMVAEGGARGERARRLRGEAAIASAKVAYQIYKELFGGERFARLAEHGARTQRVLWASTSTKDPAYSDVRYVEALIGADTINTMPRDTLDAYRDHGNPAPRLEDDVPAARRTLEELGELGIDLGEVTEQLVEEGIDKFVEPFEDLLGVLERAAGKAPA